MKHVASAGLLALALSGAAQAEVITFEFTAVIDSVAESHNYSLHAPVSSSSLNGSVIALGDTITGRFFYDLSTPFAYYADSTDAAYPGSAIYAREREFPGSSQPIEGTSAVFDRSGYEFTSDPEQAIAIPVLDNAAGAGRDAFTIEGYYLGKGRELTYPPQFGNINFVDTRGMALSSDALPRALNLADWTQATYSYSWQTFEGAHAGLLVNARLTSLAVVTSPVPEPAVLGMIGIGMLLVGARYRSEKLATGGAVREA